jgi:hypothetical protein
MSNPAELYRLGVVVADRRTLGYSVPLGDGEAI